MSKSILVITKSLENSGIPNVIFSYAKEFHDFHFFIYTTFGHLNDCLYIEKTFETLDNCTILEAPYDSIDYNCRSGKIRFLAQFKKIKHFLKKVIVDNGISIVHMHDFTFAGFFSRFFKRQSIKTIIVQIHLLSYNDKKFFSWLLYRKNVSLINRYANHVIFVSRELASKIPQFSKDKVVVVSNPIVCMGQSVLSKRINDGLLKIGQIGSFSDRKNQLFSINILYLLLQRGISTRLVFMGFPAEDGYLDLMKQDISKKKIDKYVDFLPPSFSKTDFFECIDVLLIPSKSEGSPLVALESQYLGRPAVCSNNIPAGIDFGGCHFLPLGDSFAWQEGIINAAMQRTDFISIRKKMEEDIQMNCFSIIESLYK